MNNNILPLILIGDGDQDSLDFFVKTLLPHYRLKIATDGNTLLELANSEQEKPCLIILDISLPVLDGFSVCKALKCDHKTKNIPVMFATYNDSQSAEFEALQLEAIEFVIKPLNSSTIRMRVRNLVKLKMYQDQLLELATHDPMTNLANRHKFDEFFNWEWRRGIRDRLPVALIMIDIDLFKQFNDHYGHIAGDDCIIKVAKAVSSKMRRSADLAARYGGEEFVCLMDSTDIASAINIAEQCRLLVESLAIPHQLSPHGVVTISCGVAVLVPLVNCQSQNDLLEAADKNLYLAKKSGRNLVVG